MHKRFAALVLSLTIASCGFGGDESYTIDGVPVLLEQGIGPERQHLAMAVALYRQAARRFYSLESVDEDATWRGIAGIRYTQRAVEHGATYDPDDGMVWSNWYACALDVPLYTAFVGHYSAALGSETLELDLKWADASRWELRGAVCDAAKPEHVIQWRW